MYSHRRQNLIGRAGGLGGLARRRVPQGIGAVGRDVSVPHAALSAGGRRGSAVCKIEFMELGWCDFASEPFPHSPPSVAARHLYVGGSMDFDLRTEFAAQPFSSVVQQ
jgi:hypothetical protein